MMIMMQTATVPHEKVMESIELFGIKKTIEKLNGMFSFVIWDKHKKEIIISYDI